MTESASQAVTQSINEATKVLLEWESPARVFVPKDEKYIRTVLWVLLAIGIVLVFFKEFLLYAVFLALAFVSYVLRTVPPDSINHRITEHGLVSATHDYLWKDLKDFWFTQRGDYFVLNINTNLRFPPRLFLLFPKNNATVSKEQLVPLLSSHISFRELPPENTVDKLLDTLSQKFNFS
jgi:hypothetical protein